MTGFSPPPYPYDRLNRFKHYGDAFEGGLVDFSIGTPFDPPPAAVVAAFGASNAERGYPPSVGLPALREAAAAWLKRRLDVTVDAANIAATVGSKELVANLPQWLRLRTPDRDTVLFPETSYPSYAMGATLGGCRAVSVPELEGGGIDVGAISPDDANRALVLWVNSPSNPTGALSDLERAAQWGRDHGVPVFSDECYVEFVWNGPPRTILECGLDGVVAVHSLSKRSNLAGARVGFFAGDPELVHYLSEVRKHAGMMVPGPTQVAATVALGDDDHVDLQRGRYRRRLEHMADVLERFTGTECKLPDGGFYLWHHVGDAWEFTERFAERSGALVTPGEFFGDAGREFVRVAVVQPDSRIALVGERLGY